MIKINTSRTLNKQNTNKGKWHGCHFKKVRTVTIRWSEYTTERERGINTTVGRKEKEKSEKEMETKRDRYCALKLCIREDFLDCLVLGFCVKVDARAEIL